MHVPVPVANVAVQCDYFIGPGRNCIGNGNPSFQPGVGMRWSFRINTGLS